MVSAGDILGEKFRLLRLLGQGGMGSVFEAENTWTRRRVAIKTLHASLALNDEALWRFWREAQAAASIRHPNVVDVLDMGVHAPTGEPYIVQELLDGRSLEALVEGRPDRRLDPAETLGYLIPVMGALVACHQAGIIHRDIKPANLFLSKGFGGVTVPKIIDFGISKLGGEIHNGRSTATGAPVGTPAYMSPEQARGDKDIDARTDVWSIGVVLYETLSGRRPYDAANANLIIGRILYEGHTPLADLAPHLPPRLAAAVDRALERDRQRRHRSMQALLGELLECGLSIAPTIATAANEAPVAPRASAGPGTNLSWDRGAERRGRSSGVSRGTVLGFAAALAVSAVSVGVIVTHRTPTQPLPDRSTHAHPMGATAPSTPAGLLVLPPSAPVANPGARDSGVPSVPAVALEVRRAEVTRPAPLPSPAPRRVSRSDARPSADRPRLPGGLGSQRRPRPSAAFDPLAPDRERK